MYICAMVPAEARRWYWIPKNRIRSSCEPTYRVAGNQFRGTMMGVEEQEDQSKVILGTRSSFKTSLGKSLAFVLHFSHVYRAHRAALSGLHWGKVHWFVPQLSSLRIALFPFPLLFQGQTLEMSEI